MTNSYPSSESSGSNMVCLRVADLQFWLDSRNENQSFIIPPSHQPFLQRLALPASGDPAAGDLAAGDLVLRLRSSPSLPCKAQLTPLCVTEIWELWQDEAGRYIFTAPRQSPPRWLRVAPDFTTGEVIGNFPAGADSEIYPLHGLEIYLFVNWLAGTGDLILHAVGAEIDRQGYCFLGASGAGKSTLAAALASYPEVRILGEDQVILRLRKGCFWIYGTPWHLDHPQMCSPDGVPLKKAFFLNRYAEKTVESMAPMDVVLNILLTAFIPYYRPIVIPLILERLDDLAKAIPFYTLAYHLGSDILSTVRAV